MHSHEKRLTVSVLSSRIAEHSDLMISALTSRLFSDEPQETLYHYTTFKGLLGIVDSGVLWASDLRYMNDSAELLHASDLMREEVRHQIAEGHDHPSLLNQLLEWMEYRVSDGHMVFAASFRSNGNLLSQWRGYSSVGKGVSLGFDPQYVTQCARQQGFQVGRCIYDPEQQRDIIRSILDGVVQLAIDNPEVSANDYQQLFERVESDLLRIASILKHPSFREEEEWRIVSPAITDYTSSRVHFREGTSMLVPFTRFNLFSVNGCRVPMHHLFLGPTPNAKISMHSLQMYLRKHSIEPSHGITYCDIPFREQERN